MSHKRSTDAVLILIRSMVFVDEFSETTILKLLSVPRTLTEMVSDVEIAICVTARAIKMQANITKIAVSFKNLYFVPKILSPASPRPGTMYIWSLRHSSCEAA